MNTESEGTFLSVYKVMDRSTGLYSEGGLRPWFGPRGKSWDKAGHAKAHITNEIKDKLSSIGVLKHEIMRFDTGETFYFRGSRRDLLERLNIKRQELQYILDNWEIVEETFELVGTNFYKCGDAMTKKTNEKIAQGLRDE